MKPPYSPRQALMLFSLVCLATILEGKVVYDVREEGAAADGTTLCTAALQRAIDRCAEQGGGTVHFPAGTYLSGTLVLRSHVTLHLDAGATLRGSPNPRDYPERASVLPSYTDKYVRQALLAGENLEHVALRGAGTIDGHGTAFRWKEYQNRPYVIRLVRCRDVTVEGLTLRDSPMWMQHYLACDRVRLHGLRVFNHSGYNNDGIDLDACHDVTVSDCVIDSDDDAIVLKSTLERACENVTVTNCLLSSHCNAFKLGTESTGGFRRITFSNSVIQSPRFSRSIYGSQRGLAGIALESVDGGPLENVVVTNISITGVNVALFLRLGDRGRPFVPQAPRPPIGSFRNVRIANIIAAGTGPTGCSITGVPGGMVEDVTLSDVSLEFEGGGGSELAGQGVPERVDAYPESAMFGDLPAYGLYARHVRGLTLNNVRLDTLAPDARPAVICDDVRDLELNGLSVPSSEAAAEVVRFTQVQSAQLRGFRTRGPVALLLKVEGDSTRDVALVGNDFSAVQRLVELAEGIAPGVVRQAGNVAPSRDSQNQQLTRK